MTRLTFYVAGLAACLAMGAQPAHAIPILQLYAEGATYDYTSETWVLAPQGSSSGEPFRLWAIGNIAGPGGAGPVADVRLSVAYEEGYNGDLEIWLAPARAGGIDVGSYNGFTDLYVPGTTPTPNAPVETSEGQVDGPVVTNGGAPVLSDGKILPKHGNFGPGIVWQEFSLGDMDNAGDSDIGDFIGVFPTELFSGGQVNVYEVTVSGGHGATLHFDLYDSVDAGNKAKFAPFSHDVEIVPEPSSVVVWSLLGLVCVGLGWWRRGKLAGQQ